MTLKYQKIAEICKCSLKTAKNRMKKALEILSKNLKTIGITKEILNEF